MSLTIDHLLHPAALPDDTQHVSLVQTHISLVLVADEYVYKIKKPVDFGFLDFSTLSKRHHFCHQEVKLNQRLAPAVYLGVLAILPDGKGYRLETDGGQAVDSAAQSRIRRGVRRVSALPLGRQGRYQRSDGLRIGAGASVGDAPTPLAQATRKPPRPRLSPSGGRQSELALSSRQSN